MKKQIVAERRRFKESSILFKSEKREAIDAAISTIRKHRIELETYIMLHPEFRYTLSPITIESGAPRIVKLMVNSTIPFDIGPMAAVAGVLADLAVDAMLNAGAKIAIVEDGGEIAASSNELFTIVIHAGKNVLSNRVGFQINPMECPIGVATSSANTGHAISFGEADAVTILADTARIADAAATATCNLVRGKNVEASIQKGLEFTKKFSSIIRGAIIFRGKHIGSAGKTPQLAKIKGGLNLNQVLLMEAAHSENC